MSDDKLKSWLKEEEKQDELLRDIQKSIPVADGPRRDYKAELSIAKRELETYKFRYKELTAECEVLTKRNEFYKNSIKKLFDLE